MNDRDKWEKMKETFGVYDEKSIPFLENRIAGIKDMLKSRRVIDEKFVAELKDLLDADEKRLKHLRTKQK